jgi:magnesium transporter
MSQIEDDEHAQDIRELLKYDENTAGGLMAKELGQSKRRPKCTKMLERDESPSRIRHSSTFYLCC